MSFEALIDGVVKPNKEEDVKKVLEILKKELDIKEEDVKHKGDKYWFTKIGSSNLRPFFDDELESVYLRVKEYVDKFEISVWFLKEPDLYLNEET